MIKLKKLITERVEGGNIHAMTQKELDRGIKKAMKIIMTGKVPSFDIINGHSGEMISWKEGQEYHWQPSGIMYARRELK